MTNPDITPDFPTSGQAIGFFIKSLEFPHKHLRTKTAQRYFGGSIDSIVLEKSRSMIFDAVAEVLVDLGMTPMSAEDDKKEVVDSIAYAIGMQAENWDQFRTFIRPRLPKIDPDNLAKIYTSYARLASIDLALRVGALWHITGFVPNEDILVLDWINRDKRGEYLNRKREEADLTLETFAELSGVSKKSVDDWLYNGVRPYDRHIVKIASALTKNDKSASRNALANEIRRFYWFADLSDLLTNLIGSETVKNLEMHVYQYAAWTDMLILQLKRQAVNDPDLESQLPLITLEFYLYGSRTKWGKALLNLMVDSEPDAEWKLDLEAAGGDWSERIISVSMGVSNEEVDALIESSGGRLLEDWDVGDPRAYAIYRRSMEFAMQGRTREAVAEVEKAARLDPNDPANHFSLGSGLAGIASRTGDESMMKRALHECWVAARLDPAWILPWTEIGWIHVLSGQHKEARDHLMNVPEGCGPLEPRYYQALGIANLGLGELDDALATLESGLALEPSDKGLLTFALLASAALGDDKRRRKYSKRLRHIGAGDSIASLLSR